MISTKKSKVITIRLSKKLDQKLKKYCKKTGFLQSQIIRKWLGEKLKNV